MPEESSKPTESLACPICSKPLRRTGDRLLTALECERCGPFTDFNLGSERTMSGEPGPGEPGSGPTG